LSCCHLLSSGA